MTHMLELCDDTLINIMRYLPTLYIMNVVRHVCKRFYVVSQDSRVWQTIVIRGWWNVCDISVRDMFIFAKNTLTHLDLYNTAIHDQSGFDITQALSDSRQLQYLDLSYTYANGFIFGKQYTFEFLTKLIRLKTLILKGTDFKNEDLSYISKCQLLMKLDVSSTMLTSLQYLPHMEHLQELHIDTNWTPSSEEANFLNRTPQLEILT